MLLDAPQPGKNFLVLESLPFVDDSTRVIYLLCFTRAKKAYSIGKKGDIDLYAGEKNMSDFHAQFYCDSNQIFLQDFHSKYGSLVLVKNDFPLLKDHQQAF